MTIHYAFYASTGMKFVTWLGNFCGVDVGVGKPNSVIKSSIFFLSASQPHPTQNLKPTKPRKKSSNSRTTFAFHSTNLLHKACNPSNHWSKFSLSLSLTGETTCKVVGTLPLLEAESDLFVQKRVNRCAFRSSLFDCTPRKCRGPLFTSQSPTKLTSRFTSGRRTARCCSG